MSKVLSIIIPYIMIIVAYVMSLIQWVFIGIIEAIVLGCLIGLWFLHARKTEGTKSTLVALCVTFVITIIVDIIASVYVPNILETLVLCSVLQLFALSMISKNKPRLTMTYKYSYKNKRRRYF